MKLKFLTIKKQIVCVVLVCAILLCSLVGICCAVKSTSSPRASYTIVIDAGHGGIDGGAVGKQTEVTESFLNLKYATVLKNICEQYGFNVVLTRKDMSGLYSAFAQNKKRSEMEKRKQIIEKTQPDLVVSIHMNSFSGAQSRGAQVFFQEGSANGEILADAVQTMLYKNVDYSKQTSKSGDFYVLNCSNSPSILIECGFLSNPEEELLLQKDDYAYKFCYFVLCGILQYFSFN